VIGCMIGTVDFSSQDDHLILRHRRLRRSAHRGHCHHGRDQAIDPAGSPGAIELAVTGRVPGHDRAACAPGHEGMVAVAQPAVQGQRLELVEGSAHVAIALPMGCQRHLSTDSLERPLEVIDSPAVELHQAQITASGQIGQALRDVLVIDRSPRRSRQQATIPP
jgi:hypothetical protein